MLCRVRKDIIAWRTSTTWHDEPVRFALHWSRSGVLETAGADLPCGLGYPFVNLLASLLSSCQQCLCLFSSGVKSTRQLQQITCCSELCEQ